MYSTIVYMQFTVEPRLSGPLCTGSTPDKGKVWMFEWSTRTTLLCLASLFFDLLQIVIA